MIGLYFWIMERSIITTEDGSHTIHIPALGTNYHSTHGAVQESLHVFIHAGLDHLLKHKHITPVRIFEMGFGTGLNALLTLEQALRQHLTVYYFAAELFPLEKNEYEQLNYAHRLSVDLQNDFLRLHQCEWEKDIAIKENFMLHKSKASLAEMQLQQGFDLVYFDAFDPNVQPELWEAPVFQKLYAAMNGNAVLVTYCSKGDVRRTLNACGFHIEKIPGPEGKREMIRATKDAL